MLIPPNAILRALEMSPRVEPATLVAACIMNVPTFEHYRLADAADYAAMQRFAAGAIAGLTPAARVRAIAQRELEVSMPGHFASRIVARMTTVDGLELEVRTWNGDFILFDVAARCRFLPSTSFATAQLAVECVREMFGLRAPVTR